MLYSDFSEYVKITKLKLNYFDSFLVVPKTQGVLTSTDYLCLRGKTKMLVFFQSLGIACSQFVLLR